MAILRLLSDIVAGREVEKQLESEHSHDPESEAVDSGGCACGSGSLEMRTTVAHNVVSFLFDEATPGAVGRPDLEAFLAVRRGGDLPRAAFDDYIDGCSTALAVRRLANERGLDRMVDAIALPLAEILCSAALEAEPDAAIREKSVQAIRFFTLAWELLVVRDSFVNGDRCFVPLEVLSKSGLRDTQFESWLSGKGEAATDPDVHQSCQTLMEHYKSRCLAHLAGAAHLVESLPSGPARAFAAFAGVWGDAVLVEPMGRDEPDRSLTDRLKAHRFRAWRYAISQRFDPRLVSALSEAPSSGLLIESLPQVLSSSVSRR